MSQGVSQVRSILGFNWNMNTIFNDEDKSGGQNEIIRALRLYSSVSLRPKQRCSSGKSLNKGPSHHHGQPNHFTCKPSVCNYARPGVRGKARQGPGQIQILTVAESMNDSRTCLIDPQPSAFFAKSRLSFNVLSASACPSLALRSMLQLGGRIEVRIESSPIRHQTNMHRYLLRRWQVRSRPTCMSTVRSKRQDTSEYPQDTTKQGRESLQSPKKYHPTNLVCQNLYSLSPAPYRNLKIIRFRHLGIPRCLRTVTLV